MASTKYGMSSVPHHRDKRRLIAPADRGRAAFAFANRRGVQVFGMAEMDDVTERHGRKHRPAWRGTNTPPNNQGAGRRPDIGNAIWWRRRHADLVDEGYLQQDLDSRRRNLYFPTVLLETEGGIVAVIQYHTIRAKLDLDDNREAVNIVGEYAQKLRHQGLPVVILADGNSPTAAARLAKMTDGRVGAEKDVMMVVGSGVQWLGRPGGANRGELDWTDHGVPLRTGRPLSVVVRPRRLPSP